MHTLHITKHQTAVFMRTFTKKCPLLLALNTINFNCIISMCNLNYEYFSVKENWGEKKNYCKKCLWSSMSQDSSSTICIQSMTQLLEVICDQDMFSKGDSNMNDRFLQLHKFFCLFQLVFFLRGIEFEPKRPLNQNMSRLFRYSVQNACKWNSIWEKKLSPCRQTTEANLKLNLKHPTWIYTLQSKLNAWKYSPIFFCSFSHLTNDSWVEEAIVLHKGMQSLHMSSNQSHIHS